MELTRARAAHVRSLRDSPPSGVSRRQLGRVSRVLPALRACGKDERVPPPSASDEVTSGQGSCDRGADAIPPVTADPETRFRRYGPHFGRRFAWEDWLAAVPRVRVRCAAQRQQDELLELAVVNERLAGGEEPWAARSRLELLKSRRRQWQAIYELVTRSEAAATVALIEQASQEAEALLSEESRETASVGSLQEQLARLQDEVDAASQRLASTQRRIEWNLQHVQKLREEAAALEALKAAASAPEPAAAGAALPTAGAAKGTSKSALPAAAGMRSGMVAAVPVAPASAPGSTASRAPPAGALAVQLAQAAAAARPAVRRSTGLESGLEPEDALRQFWYPVEFSSKLKDDTLVPFDLFGQAWVLFRGADGTPACLRDECAHRGCPLSLGAVQEGRVQCPYHGWEFAGDGRCERMPSTLHCRGIRVSALPTSELDGFVWVWPGDGPPPEGGPPRSTLPPEGFEIHSELVLDVPVEHGLLVENLLDLAHAPFTHTSTFARGWPVPEAVRFHAQQALSGMWDPYPIDMAFQPPCMTVSQIGLAQPGKIMRGVTAAQCKRHLHQLHVCMPAKAGHTRLLYRMSLDFMPWVKHVPFIDHVWRAVANQVLGEDLVLVLGQQDRLARGGNTWANPVSYDKLAVRYRRWRNATVRAAASSGGLVPPESRLEVRMNAGELFLIEEEGSASTGANTLADGYDSDEGFADAREAAQQKAERAIVARVDAAAAAEVAAAVVAATSRESP